MICPCQKNKLSLYYSTIYCATCRFSLFYSSIALVSIFLGPFQAVQLYLQKRFKKTFKSKNLFKFNNFLNFSIIFFILVEIILFVFFLFFLDDILVKFKSDDKLFFSFLFILHLSSLFLIIPGSILYVQRKYKLLYSVVLMTDLIRLFLFILFWKYFTNILYYFVCLNIFYNLLTLVILFRIIGIKNQFTFKIKFFFKSFLFYFSKIFRFIIYSTCFPLIMQIDIIFVKFYFNDYNASSYIVVSTIAKIIFIFPSILQYYLFEENLTAKRFNLILNYFIFISSIFFSSLILFYFKELIINLLYDKSFLLTIDAFVYLLFSFSMLSISNIILNYFLSYEKYNFLYYLFLSIILYIILNMLFHNSYIEIARNLLFSSLFLFFISLTHVIIFIFSKKKIMIN